MRTITAYETPDGKRFFDEDEARNHERRNDYKALYEASLRTNTDYARFETQLLLDFLMAQGTAISKIALAELKPTKTSGGWPGEPRVLPTLASVAEATRKG